MSKILLGGLFYLAGFFIIGWFFILGYMAQLARNVITEKQHPLPEWDNLGDLFSEGARMIGVVIIYIIPIIALVMTFIMPAVFVGAVAEGNEVAEALSGGMAGCVWCLMVPLSLFVMIFMPASLLFAVVERRFGAAFEFARIWPFIKNNIGNYLLAVLVYLIARFLASFGIALFCVGVIFTAFWAMLVQTYGFAQVYRIAVTKK